MKILGSEISTSFGNHLFKILHSRTHHQKWLGRMVSRFLWLRLIGKEANQGMLWSPLNQINTQIVF